MGIKGVGHRSDGTSYPARAMFGSAARWGRRFLKPEMQILRQSSLILLFSGMADLFPGLIMGTFEEYLILIPGLIILLPPTIGIRGNTFGALAARIGSRLHLGQIEPTMRNNRELATQLFSTAVQLMLLSALIPVAGIVLSGLFTIEIAPISTLIFISVLAGVLSGVLMFAITMGVTLISFRRGYDPDNISAPMIATTGDILTIPVMLIAAFIALNIPHALIVLFAVTSMVLLLFILSMILFLRHIEVRKVLRGSLPFAVLAILLSSISGILLQANFEMFFQGAIFLMLIPAFNAQGGSMGSILGSRLTSSAYLGQDQITLEPNRLMIRSTASLLLISFMVFFAMSLVVSGLGWISGLGTIFYPKLLLIMMMGATSITLISSFIAYYTAYISFKLGLDPDNVVIPLLTACMDIVGSTSLIVCILVGNMIF